eukprot:SAG22_NODE_725_length_7622_cov_1.958926_5_plen_180_part_00
MAKEEGAHEEGRSGETEDSPDLTIKITAPKQAATAAAVAATAATAAEEPAGKGSASEHTHTHGEAELQRLLQGGPPKIREMADFIKNQGSTKLIKQYVLLVHRQHYGRTFQVAAAVVPLPVLRTVRLKLEAVPFVAVYRSVSSRSSSLSSRLSSRLPAWPGLQVRADRLEGLRLAVLPD